MRYLPLFVDLNNRPCLVVGGGTVGARRVAQLRAAGALVTVIAPDVVDTLASLAATGLITHIAAKFDGQSVREYALVVAATDDPAENARVAVAAKTAGTFCNVVDAPELCSFIMPAVVDRDPVTIAISSAGTSPVVTRWVRSLIEDAVPARVGRLAALAGRWRERVRAALPALDQRRHFWQETLSGETAAHTLAGRDAAAEQALDRALERWRRETATAAPRGEAYIVGAGPGDPELLTLRGRRLLANADAVLYDRLVSPGVLEFARRDADLIPVGKAAGTPSITQDEINRLLVDLVASGRKICRLKGGDPMVFGRVGEELDALAAAGLPFQIVPGVSAVEGCAAYAGIPLTLRDEARAVLIATGHTRDHVAADLSGFRAGQTLALYMAVAHLGAVAEQLLALGHSPELPVAIIENGTLDQQRIVRASLATLGPTAAGAGIASPALLLVGETVRLADRFGWFAPAALAARDDAGGLAKVS